MGSGVDDVPGKGVEHAVCDPLFFGVQLPEKVPDDRLPSLHQGLRLGASGVTYFHPQIPEGRFEQPSELAHFLETQLDMHDRPLPTVAGPLSL